MTKILERREDLKKRELARNLFIKIFYAIRRYTMNVSTL